MKPAGSGSLKRYNVIWFFNTLDNLDVLDKVLGTYPTPSANALFVAMGELHLSIKLFSTYLTLQIPDPEDVDKRVYCSG